MELKNAITDVPGIRVGHAQDDKALTGCTVVLYEAGAIGGVDQRGGAPGTRETDLLRPMHLINQIHAVLLTGGSAFGLDAASGVMRYLEEKRVGYDVRVAKVPIVPAAVIFDLDIGSALVRPDASMGYQACLNASTLPPAQGNFGAGTGARVGAIFGADLSVKSGIGTASCEIAGGVIIAALVVVNAFGDVIDPANGEIIAGARFQFDFTQDDSAGPFFADTYRTIQNIECNFSPPAEAGKQSVIGVVASNALMDKEATNRIALMAQDGIARTIRPAHTLYDGDTIFALSAGEKIADTSTIGACAAEMVAMAILNAVWAAEPAGGLPSAASLRIGGMSNNKESLP